MALIPLFLLPMHSFAITLTFSDLDQFTTEISSLKDDLNSQLNPQGLYAHLYNESYSNFSFDSFFSLGGGGLNDSTFGIFGVGMYFKDFTLPLRFRFRSPGSDYTYYWINPNPANDPVFFGVVTDDLLDHFSVRTNYDLNTNSYTETASYGSPFPWGLIRNYSVAPTPTPDPIPEPATMLLLGTGLVGIAAGRKKILKK